MNSFKIGAIIREVLDSLDSTATSLRVTHVRTINDDDLEEWANRLEQNSNLLKSIIEGDVDEERKN